MGNELKVKYSGGSSAKLNMLQKMQALCSVVEQLAVPESTDQSSSQRTAVVLTGAVRPIFLA